MSNPVQKIQSLKNTAKLNDFKFPKTLGSDEEKHFTYLLQPDPVLVLMTGKLFRCSGSGPCIGHTQTMGICDAHETQTSVQSSHKHRGTQQQNI